MKSFTTVAVALFCLTVARSQSAETAASVALDKLNEQQALNVKTDLMTYKGQKALRVIDTAPPDSADGLRLVILKGTEFGDGAIEIDLAGEPNSTASQTARGFVGVAFRLSIEEGKNTPRYECFYVRPTNGRVDDQVRRNHATQYISYPDLPWFKLRQDFPGKYESYADMVAGEWTGIKIEVHGEKGRLYVNHSPQPVLVVDDVKKGHGQIALWVGPETTAHFANLRVMR